MRYFHSNHHHHHHCHQTAIIFLDSELTPPPFEHKRRHSVTLQMPLTETGFWGIFWVISSPILLHFSLNCSIQRENWSGVSEGCFSKCIFAKYILKCMGPNLFIRSVPWLACLQRLRVYFHYALPNKGRQLYGNLALICGPVFCLLRQKTTWMPLDSCFEFLPTVNYVLKGTFQRCSETKVEIFGVKSMIFSSYYSSQIHIFGWNCCVRFSSLKVHICMYPRYPKYDLTRRWIRLKSDTQTVGFKSVTHWVTDPTIWGCLPIWIVHFVASKPTFEMVLEQVRFPDPLGKWLSSQSGSPIHFM